METKLLEERIDALNANLEKILGLMDRIGVFSKQFIEQTVEELKIKKETLEETKRHNKAIENYNPIAVMSEDTELMEKFAKIAVAAQDKARNSEDDWWKGNENG